MSARPVTVVTGATSGIGRALALEYARRGHRILGVGRAAEKRAALLADLEAVAPQAGHETLGLDVGDASAMAQLSARLAEIGRVDVLICSAVAGRDPGSGAPPRTRDLPLSDWQRAIDVNLHGVFLADQAVLPFMRDAGDGDILHIGSSTTPQGLCLTRAAAPKAELLTDLEWAVPWPAQGKPRSHPCRQRPRFPVPGASVGLCGMGEQSGLPTAWKPSL